MVHRTLLLSGVALLLVMVTAALADWDPSMPAKWVQSPDETELGVDVNASYTYILADDFLCMETGYITSIHIWGSWYRDMMPPNGPDDVNFTLSIHADIPVGPEGYSVPGEVLWAHTFRPGEFISRNWLAGAPEGWMEPWGFYEPSSDYNIWQYNFPMPPDEPFMQEGTAADPIIYWLDVKAEPFDGASFFGWKCSLEQWNDDAVWAEGSEPYPGPWDELVYPPEHEYAGNSLDLAFVIVGEEQEIDWGDAPDGPYPTLAGSGGANHVIGGPWLGDDTDAPDPEIDGQPESSAMGDDTDGNDDEDGVVIPVLVAGTTQAITVEINDGGSGSGGYLDAWFDFDGDGTWSAAELVYSGFLADGTYNINVNTPSTAFIGQTFARFRVNLAGPLPPTGPATEGEVEDHEVRIIEEETYKWIQLPDLSDAGVDVHAIDPYILADDYMCIEPGRITEIWVWGSWYNDYLPFDDQTAVDFTLSIHSDIPASHNPDGYSIPGDLLWYRNFATGEFSAEVEATGLAEGYLIPPDLYFYPGDTICWLYKFHVPPDDAFFQWGSENNPVIYWLDVQAYPHDPDANFGWKSSVEQWNDDAVYGEGLEPFLGPWFELRYPPNHPYYPESIDLAFMLRNDQLSGVPGETREERFGLYQNEPNPFSGETTIRYSLATRGKVRLDIFNVRGQVVSTLVDTDQAAGPHTATWSGHDTEGRELPAGVYFCKLTVGSESATKKMLYLK